MLFFYFFGKLLSTNNNIKSSIFILERECLMALYPVADVVTTFHTTMGVSSNGLNGLVLHGVVKGLVETPREYKDVKLLPSKDKAKSSALAILQVYGISCLQENVFGTNSTKDYLVPESTVLFCLEDFSLIGQFVSLYGSSKSNGGVLRRSQLAKSDRSGYYMPVFMKKGDEWYIKPNKISLFNSKLVAHRGIRSYFKDLAESTGKVPYYYLDYTKKYVSFEASKLEPTYLSGYTMEDYISLVGRNSVVQQSKGDITDGLSKYYTPYSAVGRSTSNLEEYKLGEIPKGKRKGRGISKVLQNSLKSSTQSREEFLASLSLAMPLSKAQRGFIDSTCSKLMTLAKSFEEGTESRTLIPSTNVRYSSFLPNRPIFSYRAVFEVLLGIHFSQEVIDLQTNDLDYLLLTNPFALYFLGILGYKDVLRVAYLSSLLQGVPFNSLMGTRERDNTSLYALSSLVEGVEVGSTENIYPTYLSAMKGIDSGSYLNGYFKSSISKTGTILPVTTYHFLKVYSSLFNLPSSFLVSGACSSALGFKEGNEGVSFKDSFTNSALSLAKANGLLVEYPSGSSNYYMSTGLSTLVELLEKFYEVKKGKVRVFGSVPFIDKVFAKDGFHSTLDLHKGHDTILFISYGWSCPEWVLGILDNSLPYEAQWKNFSTVTVDDLNKFSNLVFLDAEYYSASDLHSLLVGKGNEKNKKATLTYNSISFIGYPYDYSSFLSSLIGILPYTSLEYYIPDFYEGSVFSTPVYSTYKDLAHRLLFNWNEELETHGYTVSTGGNLKSKGGMPLVSLLGTTKDMYSATVGVGVSPLDIKVVGLTGNEGLTPSNISHKLKDVLVSKGLNEGIDNLLTINLSVAKGLVTQGKLSYGSIEEDIIFYDGRKVFCPSTLEATFPYSLGSVPCRVVQYQEEGTYVLVLGDSEYGFKVNDTFTSEDLGLLLDKFGGMAVSLDTVTLYPSDVLYCLLVGGKGSLIGENSGRLSVDYLLKTLLSTKRGISYLVGGREGTSGELKLLPSTLLSFRSNLYSSVVRLRSFLTV